MSDSHKKKLMELHGEKEIPIIKNGVCGELYFGKYRPNTI
jgi:hypothetical protein